MEPSGENATARTPCCVCPSSVAISVRVAISHSLTVPSADPEARVEPSGENATEMIVSVCASSVAIFVCVATFHSLTVPPPEARVKPSGENTI